VNKCQTNPDRPEPNIGLGKKFIIIRWVHDNTPLSG
jgi:hypothetical protein